LVSLQITFMEDEKSENRSQHGRGRSTPMKALWPQSVDSPDVASRARAQLISSPVLDNGSGGVKLRILEQENDRLVKKIKGLELQLADLERMHGQRIEELLAERRKEKEKETARHREALKHAENSLVAREKIYKERIHKLEGQVDSLKEKVAKENRRRQLFISSERHCCSHYWPTIISFVLQVRPASATR